MDLHVALEVTRPSLVPVLLRFDHDLVQNEHTYLPSANEVAER